jgi:hypothetical protein
VHHVQDLRGEVDTMLGMRPEEVWLVRPDAHVAAVLVAPSGEDVVAALTRLLGQPTAVPV